MPPDGDAAPAPKPRRKPPSVRQVLVNVFACACLLGVMRSCRILSIGPAGGPMRSITVFEFFGDSFRVGDEVRILFINNSPRVIRSVAFGAKGEYGRFGPLAPGERCECRMPNPSSGATVPMTYLDVQPTGDLAQTWPISPLGWGATRAYTYNPDRSMVIEHGPFPPSR